MNPKESFFMTSIRLYIQVNELGYWLHICGGCLISLRHILTAAQCIILLEGRFNSTFKNAAAFVGNLDLDGTSKRYFIRDFEKHNGYNENDVYNTAVNDIGLILLEDEVKPSDVVNKIALHNSPAVPSIGVTMGWGSRKKTLVKNVLHMNNGEELSRSLLAFIVEVTKCQTFKKYSKGLVNKDELNFLWGYGLDADAHTSVGDAGNPLIVRNGNKPYVAGVATYIPTNLRKYPNFFVSVKNHEDWIRQAMKYLSNKPMRCTANAA